MAREHPIWYIREDELRDRGWVPQANVAMTAPPTPEGGWRSTFTDQEGRPVEEKLGDAVAALAERAAAGIAT